VTLSHLKDILTAEVVCGHEKLSSVEVSTAFGADLMSDVLAFARSGCLLITGLTTPQTVRTAFALDIAGILVCRGKQPQPQAVDIARELGIPILRTEHIMFETCGILYREGMRGCVCEISAGDRPSVD